MPYLQVFVWRAEKIRTKGYETLYSYTTTGKRRSLFGMVVQRAPPHLRPITYMGVHLALTAVTLSFTTVWQAYLQSSACSVSA